MAASQNVGAVVKALQAAIKPDPSSMVDEVLGLLLHVYYRFVKYYHLRPLSLMDMAEGTISMDINNKLEREAIGAHG